jgi:hypothetical protein
MAWICGIIALSVSELQLNFIHSAYPTSISGIALASLCYTDSASLQDKPQDVSFLLTKVALWLIGTYDLIDLLHSLAIQ